MENDGSIGGVCAVVRLVQMTINSSDWSLMALIGYWVLQSWRYVSCREVREVHSLSLYLFLSFSLSRELLCISRYIEIHGMRKLLCGAYERPRSSSYQ